MGGTSVLTGAAKGVAGAAGATLGGLATAKDIYDITQKGFTAEDVVPLIGSLVGGTIGGIAAGGVSAGIGAVPGALAGAGIGNAVGEAALGMERTLTIRPRKLSALVLEGGTGKVTASRANPLQGGTCTACPVTLETASNAGSTGKSQGRFQVSGFKVSGWRAAFSLGAGLVKM